MSCALTGLVAGLDEAGRAPLAGPVVSACVIWDGPPPDKHEGVNDSKLLTEKQREYLFDWIQDNAYRVGVGIASNDEIEKLNIHHASLLSMERAVAVTAVSPGLVLVDGLFPLKERAGSVAVVKGDRKCFYIACASIIAKVHRDRMMVAYDTDYPQYQWKKNKGYPTPEHKQAILDYGITPLHRKTFRGVKEIAG